MDGLYKFFIHNIKEAELKDAIVLSPGQVISLLKFIYVTKRDIEVHQTDFPDLNQVLNYDINILHIMTGKLKEVQNYIPQAFTLFEGLILTNLTISFKYTHYDIDKIGEDIEQIGFLLDDMFHERGYLPVFYILKEDRLSE